MVTGSFASALHGQPRATRDIDVIIDPTETAIEILIAAFPADRFYVGDAASALASRDMFNVVDVRSGWKVDLIIRKDRAFSREEFSRRQPIEMAGVPTFVSTVEDAILSKLEWYAMSDSDTQRRDVVEMMVANRNGMDWDYMETWATELGLSDLLVDVWADATSER